MRGGIVGRSKRRNCDGRGPGYRVIAFTTLTCIAAVLGSGVIESGAAAPGAYGWGNNQSGEVADGTMAPRNAPVGSVGLQTAQTMSVGEEHGLALLGDGSVVAWGHNKSGQLGNGSTVDS